MTRRQYPGYLWTLIAACGPSELALPCSIAQANLPLSRDIVESSGLALSRRNPGVLWTHNDSGHEPFLFAIDSNGRTHGKVRVTGAELVDWEDMALGPCDAGDCLFIGDIGDNLGNRDSISIYVVPEPLPSDTATMPARALSVRYPDGPRDAEAMFVLPSGDLHLITKGRRDSIALYHLPKEAMRPDSTVTLERVRVLGPRPSEGDDRVTGAGARADGLQVALRTYRSLSIYSTSDLLGGGEPILTVDTRSLKQPVGESVALGGEGQIWLGSEGGGFRTPPRLARIACTLPIQ
jgi:hypothetical protein